MTLGSSRSEVLKLRNQIPDPFLNITSNAYARWILLLEWDQSYTLPILSLIASEIYWKGLMRLVTRLPALTSLTVGRENDNNYSAYQSPVELSYNCNQIFVTQVVTSRTEGTVRRINATLRLALDCCPSLGTFHDATG